MTEYIANMLTKNMYMDGLIKESEESIYSYSCLLYTSPSPRDS